MARAAGRYRIQAVAELTGVQEATLRAWERRYGLPAPERTATGYRLYSHKDVETVKRMVELCARGMAPADAARALGSHGHAPTAAEAQGDPYDTAAQRLVEAARRMHPAAIESEVRFALTLGDAYTIVERVFCPAMLQIGRDWEAGMISVAHEHLAAEIVSSATRDLLRLIAPARPVGEALLACFAEEEHSLPLYAAAFRFVEWGHRAHVLGARTPPEALARAVQELDPSVIGLSATITIPARRASELVNAYADGIGARRWIVGGAAAPSMRAQVEARGGIVLTSETPDQDELLGRLLR
jgi:DNA-binding transcriptional MerR regulator/methylmalonyl-CoA mutase cobalamin-binding subunit